LFKVDEIEGCLKKMGRVGFDTASNLFGEDSIWALISLHRCSDATRMWWASACFADTDVKIVPIKKHASNNKLHEAILQGCPAQPAQPAVDKNEPVMMSLKTGVLRMLQML
jgi:hypothetical protein